MPGLVNAHTHLELSYLRDEVPPASEFVAWIRAVMAARRAVPDPKAPTILDAVDRGIAEAVRCGTAVVGDISNTLVTFEPLARSPLAAVVFYELIRFNAPDPEAVVERAPRSRSRRCRRPTAFESSLAAHAPYSVAPLVLRAIRRALDRDPFAPCSVHLAESAEEVEFIRTGGGPWRALLEELGVVGSGLGGARRQPGAVSGRERLSRRARAGRPRRADDGGRSRAAGRARDDARHLSAQQRAHRRRRAADRGVLRLRRAGRGRHRQPGERARSESCSPSWRRCARSRRRCRPSTLLDSATRQGARALGFDADYGTIEPGKRARLLAVDDSGGHRRCGRISGVGNRAGADSLDRVRIRMQIASRLHDHECVHHDVTSDI